MANEINAQNELDLILKGMEEIDNRVSDETAETVETVEIEDVNDIEVVEEVEDIPVEMVYLNTEDTTESETVSEPEAASEPELVSESETEAAPELEEKTEKKGLLAGLFGSKKKEELPGEDEAAAELEAEPEAAAEPETVVVDETQKKIEELQEISAERLAILQQLSFEADEMRRQTLQLESHTLSLEEKTKKLAEEKEAIQKEADALESLLQEKYVRIEELEGMLRDPDVVSGIGLEISSNDIRTMIRDILPDIKAMSTEAMVDFTLRVDDVYDPIVFCDRDRINAMIIKMIFCGLRYSNTGEKLKFSISQKEPVATEYAEYKYSCIYKGDVVDFYSEEAAEMGGIVDIKRSEDGYVEIAVRFRFKIDIPELRERTLEFEKAALEDYNL